MSYLRLLQRLSNLISLSIWLLLAVKIVGFASEAEADPAPSHGRTDAIQMEVAAKLEAALQSDLKASNGTAGGAVLVARNGVVLMSKGFGYANLEWKIPNTPSTRMHVASVTKSFTATVIMQLREKGLVDLQNSICSYVSPCAQVWRPVTIHHLLSHTSGIPNWRRGETWESVYYLSPIAHVAHILDEPLEFDPGVKFRYSNSGYILLGLVIEKVTGKSYEQVIGEQIFKPAGMHDSGYDHPDSVIERRATGYAVADSRFVREKGADRFSTGGLYSTAEDLYKFDQALYGTTLLSRASLDLMWSPVAPSGGGERSAYGYGWWLPPLTASRGHRAIQGLGGGSGFRCELWRFPEERATIIVLTNMPGDIRSKQLGEILFGESPRAQRALATGSFLGR